MSAAALVLALVAAALAVRAWAKARAAERIAVDAWREARHAIADVRRSRMSAEVEARHVVETVRDPSTKLCACLRCGSLGIRGQRCATC